MKIAVISIIREPWGGSEELWASMARRALQTGYKVIHSTYNFGGIADKEKKLMEVGLQHFTRIGFISTGKSFIQRIPIKIKNFIISRINNPFNHLFKEKPDYILYNGTCYSILDEEFLLKKINKTSVPFGIIAHYNQEKGADLPKGKGHLALKIFQSAKHIFFVSKRTWETAEKSLSIKLENGILIRNPVNLASTEIIPYNKTPVIQLAMVGNLRIIHKGQDIVIKILSQPGWREKNWHLNIYGHGEDEALLKKMVTDYQLNHKVSFHGRVDNIRNVWSINNILLMPSRMEGMPLAVVEAMICGRPSVVTDVGGHTEWIEDGSEGFIAANATTNSFEKSMSNAWENISNWESLGVKAHSKAMSLYDPNPGETLLDYIKNVPNK